MTTEQHDLNVSSGPKDEACPRERRASIKAIMEDSHLSNLEKRKSIQSLMDGRRRSSVSIGMKGLCIDVNEGENDYIKHSSLERDAALVAAQILCEDGFSSSEEECADMDKSERKSRKRTSHLDSQQILPFPTCLVIRDEDKDKMRINYKMIAYDHLGNPKGNTIQMELHRPHCSHYDRKCSIISPCCGMLFGCRICHDECDALPPPFLNMLKTNSNVNRNDESSHDSQPAKRRISTPSSPLMEEGVEHEINRFDIKEIVCRNCHQRQSSKRNKCMKCDVQFGEYHCEICNLWMDSSQQPYHCDDCGLCRVGGQNNFKHCLQCGICVDKSSYAKHNCLTYEANCPVCLDDLFSSRRICHEMPCGHVIHWDCFTEYSRHDLRCPICKKTTSQKEESLELWNTIANEISVSPLHPDTSRVIDIFCNDCEEYDRQRSWHYLGIQCHNCDSFNTVVTNTR